MSAAIDPIEENGGAEKARSKRASLALCLSGGGYRAALFHLGALWRLHELGLLVQVDRISSVSGGSILAAFVADRIAARAAVGSFQVARAGDYQAWCATLDFRKDVAEPFGLVTATDIRTWPILKTLLLNLVWHRFGARDLERSYRRLVTRRVLADLPDHPNFIFSATDLVFGVNFEFSKQRVGDYQAGYFEADDHDPGRFAVAKAVAASSCFPPLFGPMRIATKGYKLRHGHYRKEDRAALIRQLHLTDGGVYDNLATEPVIKHADTILVSDAGAPFEFEASNHTLRRLMRYTTVISNQAQALRKRLFVEMRMNGRFNGGIWSLRQQVEPGAFGYSSALIEDVLAQIRTDLDHFTRAEFEVLVNHGYASCAAALYHRDDIAGNRRMPAAWPYPERFDEEKIRAELKSSHRRLVLPRLLAGIARRFHKPMPSTMEE